MLSKRVSGSAFDVSAATERSKRRTREGKKTRKQEPFLWVTQRDEDGDEDEERKMIVDDADDSNSGKDRQNETISEAFVLTVRGFW